MDIGFDSFKEAEHAFRRFLASRGVNANIRWIYREDVAIRRGVYLIQLPKPWELSNRPFALKQFYLSREREQQLRFKCIAQDARISACYIEEHGTRNDCGHDHPRSKIEFWCPDFPARMSTAFNLFTWKFHKRRSDSRVTFLPYRNPLKDLKLPANALPNSRPKMLCTVADSFTIRGRGIFVVAKETYAKTHDRFNEDFPYRVGDRIELRKPDGSTVSTHLQSTHSTSMASPYPGPLIRGLGFGFSKNVGMSDVPAGTEVWIVSGSTDGSSGQ